MVRTIDFRYKVMRNGAEYGSIYPVDGNAPKIWMDNSSNIKTHLSGTFLAPDRDTDWLTDQIRPELIINGVSYHAGIFLPASIQETDHESYKSITLEAYDQCWVVRDHRAESMPYFPAGTNYVEAVISMLAEAGITLIRAEETDEVMTEDREDWSIGTSYLDIINQLLNEINYNPLWFNADGVAVIEPISTASAVHVDHYLDDSVVEHMLMPGKQSKTDLYSQANVFICVCSNADKSGPMLAVAENTNPQSPLSIGRRGRRISKIITIDNIASQEALQTYASRQVTDSLLSSEIITVQTALLPGYGVGDITAIRIGGVMTVCKETAWTMELRTGGPMVHTLERSVIALA